MALRYDPRKSTLREPGRLGSKHAVKFCKNTLHQIKIRERKGPSRGIIQKCAPLERCPCAPKFRKDHMRRPCTKRDVPAELCGIWRKYLPAQEFGQTTFCTPIEAKVMSAPTSKRPEDREFVVDSGASMHMMSKKKRNKFRTRLGFYSQQNGAAIQRNWSSYAQEYTIHFNGDSINTELSLVPNNSFCESAQYLRSSGELVSSIRLDRGRKGTS